MDDRPRDGELGQQRGHDHRHLHLVVECQRVLVDHVNVRLRELAKTSLLRSLSSPHLLDLIPAKRELEFSRVLHDVARKRDGEVEVQAEAGICIPLSMEAPNDVHLFVDLALACEFSQWLDRASFQ